MALAQTLRKYYADAETSRIQVVAISDAMMNLEFLHLALALSEAHPSKTTVN